MSLVALTNQQSNNLVWIGSAQANVLLAEKTNEDWRIRYVGELRNDGHAQKGPQKMLIEYQF